jgi:transposase
MSRVNTPELSAEDRNLLEKGHKNGKTHAFRKRCQVILLKSEGRTSKSVGSIVKMSNMSVDAWVRRYKVEGIEGLHTKPGRGRKPLLNKETDQESILAAVKSNRQRVDMAKAEWEAAQGGKTVSRDVFRRFLKALAEGTNEFGAGASENPMKHSIGSN